MMKHLLLTTIAAVLLVWCGESQQSAPSPEAKPEPTTAEAPDISIHEAVGTGNIEAIKKHLAAGADVNANVNTRDVDGETPLDVAIHPQNSFNTVSKEIADLLRNHSGKTSKELKAEEK